MKNFNNSTNNKCSHFYILTVIIQKAVKKLDCLFVLIKSYLSYAVAMPQQDKNVGVLVGEMKSEYGDGIENKPFCCCQLFCSDFGSIRFTFIQWWFNNLNYVSILKSNAVLLWAVMCHATYWK